MGKDFSERIVRRVQDNRLRIGAKGSAKFVRVVGKSDGAVRVRGIA